MVGETVENWAEKLADEKVEKKENYLVVVLGSIKAVYWELLMVIKKGDLTEE
jgi:hypothetical protein